MGINTQMTKNKPAKKTGGIPAEFDLDAARKEFQGLLKGLKKLDKVSKTLGPLDEYYFSYEGYCEFMNVKRDRAALGPTKRAINVLEALKEKRAKRKKTIQRQKIQTVNAE